MEKDDEVFYDVWGDNVSLKDLLIAMVASIAGTLGGYLIAPSDQPLPLIFGLAGGIVAFIICSFFFKPKRRITKEEEVSE